VRWPAGGGEKLFFEQVLQGGLEGGLIGFDRHEVIAAFLKEDQLPGFHLSVQCVGQHDFAVQIQTAEHLPGRRNLIALGLGNDSPQVLPMAVGGIDHLDATVPHFLAIHNHQIVLNGPSQSLLPSQEDPFQRAGVHAREQPGKGGFLGAAM